MIKIPKFRAFAWTLSLFTQRHMVCFSNEPVQLPNGLFPSLKNTHTTTTTPHTTSHSSCSFPSSQFLKYIGKNLNKTTYEGNISLFLRFSVIQIVFLVNSLLKNSRALISLPDALFKTSSVTTNFLS